MADGVEQEDREERRSDALPGWAATLIRVGGITIIAIYLVRVVSAITVGDLQTIRTTLAAHEAAAQQLRLEFDTFRADQGDFFVTLLALEQRICLNTANDGVERQACLNPEPKPVHHPGGGH